MSRRVSTAGLLELGAGLAERERQLLRDVDRLRLLTHDQIGRLLGDDADASPVSAARITRRMLARLTDAGVLSRLDRRVGGIRAGPAGYVYYLGPVGQRLIAYWEGRGLTRGRFRPEPGGRYVRHRLAVSEIDVSLREAERSGLLELLAFNAEPDCWRTMTDQLGGETLLKPDAFARIGIGAYEDQYFIEVDLSTESRSVIARKLKTYVSYWNSGIEQQMDGVFPRVLLITNSEERKSALVETCEQMPVETWQLFTITTLNDFMAVFTGQLGSGQDERETEALS